MELTIKKIEGNTFVINWNYQGDRLVLADFLIDSVIVV
jgi:hypothetical protein